MRGRGYKLALLFGGLAGIGLVAPFALGQDPGYTTVVSVLRGLGVVGFIGGLLLLFGASGASAPIGDEVYAPPQPAPRTLTSNPLAASAATRPLPDRLDAAIEASQSFSRSIGVIYFNLDSYRLIARSKGVEAAEKAMDAVVVALATRLRNTDRIERAGRGRLVACIVLLPDRKALLSIQGRLEAAMQSLKVEALPGAAIVWDVGVSIYPMGGYTGEDLIANAQARCDEAHAERIRAEARKRKLAAAATRRERREQDAPAPVAASRAATP